MWKWEGGGGIGGANGCILCVLVAKREITWVEPTTLKRLYCPDALIAKAFPLNPLYSSGSQTVDRRTASGT